MASENLYSGKNDNYRTPAELLETLDREFHFDGPDPCSINPEGLRRHDGLGDWAGTRIFVNPPYSNVEPWIRRAILESRRGKIVVMLLKNDRSTGWFHDLVKPNAAELRDLRGRVKFLRPGWTFSSPAPFPSLLAIFRPTLVSTPSTQKNHELTT